MLYRHEFFLAKLTAMVPARLNIVRAGLADRKVMHEDKN
jgi:hypothetical protein